MAVLLDTTLLYDLLGVARLMCTYVRVRLLVVVVVQHNTVGYRRQPLTMKATYRTVLCVQKLSLYILRCDNET